VSTHVISQWRWFVEPVLLTEEYSLVETSAQFMVADPYKTVTKIFPNPIKNK
jgi:hypothetical protein